MTFSVVADNAVAGGFTVDYNFTDIEGDTYEKVIIYLDSTPGTFKYNGVITSGVIEIAVEDVVNLTLTRPDNLIYSESLTFRISDNNIKNLKMGNQTNNIRDVLFTAQ